MKYDASHLFDTHHSDLLRYFLGPQKDINRIKFNCKCVLGFQQDRAHEKGSVISPELLFFHGRKKDFFKEPGII